MGTPSAGGSGERLYRTAHARYPTASTTLAAVPATTWRG